ncbi:MAG: hypothetical protein OR995_01415 [Candidatus Nanopelagicales bacterium]|nr:hypothetical protein [Candidatus Nanopelagicales bacterium]
MIKSERVLPVTGGSGALSTTKPGKFDTSLHLSNGELLAVLADKTFTDFGSGSMTARVGETLTRAVRLESRRSIAAVRASRKRISRGQALVAIQIERYLTRLESEGRYGTAAVISEALRGDVKQLQARSLRQLETNDSAEFFAIVDALHDIQVMRDDLAHSIACLPAYPLESDCTEPEFLKTPDQTLCGAVSIKAPPALPTDVTHMGYAVGLVA